MPKSTVLKNKYAEKLIAKEDLTKEEATFLIDRR